MLKNIVRGEWETETWYELCFYYDEDKSSGFVFPCRMDGTLIEEDMTEDGMRNYEFCMKNPENFAVPNEFERHTRRWRNPDRGQCKCGAEVVLHDQYRGACGCPECGRWYNLYGQELLPPDQWEDDGEDW